MDRKDFIELLNGISSRDENFLARFYNNSRAFLQGNFHESQLTKLTAPVEPEEVAEEN